MPTYDYVCRACEHRLELYQSMTEAPKKKCPKCGKPKLQRLIGAGAAILFKGSGFYQTDYRSSSYTAGAKQEAAPEKAKPEGGAKDSGTPSTGKQDSQPAADAHKSAKKSPKAE